MRDLISFCKQILFKYVLKEQETWVRFIFFFSGSVCARGFYKGVAECGKETNTRFFFFRGLLDTPPPCTFLIEYVFPRLMSFFFKKIQKIYV